MQAETVRISCPWACGVCSAVCGKGAITYAAGELSVDMRACSKCMVCVNACPSGIIGEDRLA